jgi:hypothetical protein
MKTFISEIIPKLQRFSQRLDDLTILTNQHWVVVDEIMNTKNIYIFRTNGELLISQSGKVQKAKWEYLGNDSLLIDKSDESFLFKHGFIDSNILALKVDSRNEYAFLVNENKYEGELNSIAKVVDFLRVNYLGPYIDNELNLPLQTISFPQKKIKTKKGILIIKSEPNSSISVGDLAYLDSKRAPDGRYVYGWPVWNEYILIRDGKIKKI